MINHLEKIANAKVYEFSELIRGYEAWKVSSETDRADYRTCRLKLLDKYGCSYFDSARLLETSGSSCGIKKKYKWGPCFEEQFAFFDWLKFHWFEPYQWVVYFKLAPDSSSVWSTTQNVSPRYKLLAINPNKLIEQSKEIWQEATDFGESKIVIYIMPTYARLLIARGFNFNLFDPTKTVIYTTGEATSPEITSFFTNLGFTYIDGMRVWTGGATFITCQKGNKHWIDFLSDNTMVNGEMKSTDYYNLAQTFINFSTGDRMDWSRGQMCDCGLPIDHIDFTEQKINTIDVGAEIYSYQDLNACFLRAVVEVGKTDLLCCSFGFDKNQIIAYYETLRGDKLNEEALATSFANKLKLPDKTIRVVHEGKYGTFKTKRLFRLDSSWPLEMQNKPLKML